MTGIFGNSQEDKIRELELEAHLEKESCDDDAPLVASVANYTFPEYLHNNLNFVQFVRGMSYADLSGFVYYIAIIADEKVERDTRHWAADELNVFLNKLVNDRSAK